MNRQCAQFGSSSFTGATLYSGNYHTSSSQTPVRQWNEFMNCDVTLPGSTMLDCTRRLACSWAVMICVCVCVCVCVCMCVCSFFIICALNALSRLGLSDSTFSTITIVAEAIVIFAILAIFDSFTIVCLPMLGLLIRSPNCLAHKHNVIEMDRCIIPTQKLCATVWSSLHQQQQLFVASLSAYFGSDVTKMADTDEVLCNRSEKALEFNGLRKWLINYL